VTYFFCVPFPELQTASRTQSSWTWQCAKL